MRYVVRGPAHGWGGVLLTLGSRGTLPLVMRPLHANYYVGLVALDWSRRADGS
jgi:hypothetical protein